MGLIWGIDLFDGDKAAQVARECFSRGLILERAGRDNGVVKLMPSLVIPEETLLEGLAIVRDSLAHVMK
jgi:diaminobutyrate-2-oxoglutarate transaminase